MSESHAKRSGLNCRTYQELISVQTIIILLRVDRLGVPRDVLRVGRPWLRVGAREADAHPELTMSFSSTPRSPTSTTVLPVSE